ncbi:methylthioribose kinase-like [Haliotis cracherodii]|uniref:methylthioribose kinase-like n=1 Tax=Haliotis cracherodii TaxID=6455 RepID=UPI0039EA54F8
MAHSNTSGDSSQIQDNVLKVVTKYSHLEQLQWAGDISKLKIVNEDRSNVFRVYFDGSDSSSIVVHGATPMDAKEPHRDNAQLEFNALTKFDSLAPGSAVKPVFYDPESKILCTEDLRDYVIYRNSLISGHLDEDAALKLARDVAVIHRDTHVANIGADAIKQLDKEFQNATTLTIREQLLFTSPFTPGDPSHQCSDAVKARLDWLYGDQEVLRAAAEMKRVFLEKKEALVHGDLHTGSIMVKDKDAKITNAGCSYVGPCSLDLGLLVANYIFTYYCHILCPEDNDNRRVFAYRVVEMCNKTVDEYFKHMTSVTEDVEIYQAKFISEMAGFAGCEIIRRLVGPSHVGEFDHTQDAEIDALGAGVRLLKAYDRIHSIGTLMLIALMLA